MKLIFCSKHGDMEALIRDNLIGRGDVWFHLKDFSLVLATIVTSLRNFMDLEGGEDGDLAMMDVQDAEDADREQKDDADADDDIFQQNGPTKGAPVAAVAEAPKKKKKAKVLDSWEDGSDDESVGDGSDASGDFASGPAWDGDGEQKLPQVLRMFELVQAEFDEKFRSIWS